jgi:hypothetical protein
MKTLQVDQTCKLHEKNKEDTAAGFWVGKAVRK